MSSVYYPERWWPNGSAPYGARDCTMWIHGWTKWNRECPDARRIMRQALRGPRPDTSGKTYAELGEEQSFFAEYASKVLGIFFAEGTSCSRRDDCNEDRFDNETRSFPGAVLGFLPTPVVRFSYNSISNSRWSREFAAYPNLLYQLNSPIPYAAVLAPDNEEVIFDRSDDALATVSSGMGVSLTGVRGTDHPQVIRLFKKAETRTIAFHKVRAVVMHNISPTCYEKEDASFTDYPSKICYYSKSKSELFLPLSRVSHSDWRKFYEERFLVTDGNESKLVMHDDHAYVPHNDRSFGTTTRTRVIENIPCRGGGECTLSDVNVYKTQTFACPDNRNNECHTDTSVSRDISIPRGWDNDHKPLPPVKYREVR